RRRGSRRRLRSRSMPLRIAVVPGDGIGPEVARAGVRLLERLSALRGLSLEFDWFDFGADRYLRDGTILPDGFLDLLRREYAAVYFGAVGDPRVPGNEHAKGILLAMRFELDLYVTCARAGCSTIGCRR